MGSEMCIRDSPNRVGESLDVLLGRSAPGVFNAGGYLSFLMSDGTTYNSLGNLFGPNESYDAPDYQNMWLSGRDRNGNRIASFNRPSLDAFHASTVLGHKFSAFDRLPGGSFQLEVDTDNDGVLDAFWMDIGLPIQTSPDGLRYKPLVAYRVVDQDGLVNLNVAGNLSDQINGAVSVQGLSLIHI